MLELASTLNKMNLILKPITKSVSIHFTYVM